MIGKKLLSEVLSVNVSKISWANPAVIVYDYGVKDKTITPLTKDINIYELAHKCKEWAKVNGYFLETRFIIDFKKHRCLIHYEEEGQEYTVPTCVPLCVDELDAVLEACEWIMEQEERK